MKFLSVFLTAALAITSFASASPLTKRDFATVQADSTQLNARADGLDKAIKAYPNSGGTLLAAIPIQRALGDISTTIKKTTDDTKATPAFTVAQSRTILDSFQKLKPLVVAATDGIKLKKPSFDANGGITTVRNALSKLRADIVPLGQELVAHCATALKGEANTLNADIVNAVDGAAKFYGA